MANAFMKLLLLLMELSRSKYQAHELHNCAECQSELRNDTNADYSALLFGTFPLPSPDATMLA